MTFAGVGRFKQPLTKKLSFVEYSDDSFLAVLGHNGELHAILLNEEDCIRDLTLNEDVLTVSMIV
jgi:hypothetical protein